ncbi:transposase [Niabella hibiscisoli]|nr:transposase [Niabella hibiscisoli]
MGQHMRKAGTYKTTNRSGYEQTITRYRAADCNDCPLRGMCHGQKGNRVVEVNHRLRTLKQQAAERLRSPEGIARRKNRCADVEPVFANIKDNKGFRRFMLKGMEKVLIETGLIALAHNL